MEIQELFDILTGCCSGGRFKLNSGLLRSSSIDLLLKEHFYGFIDWKITQNPVLEDNKVLLQGAVQEQAFPLKDKGLDNLAVTLIAGIQANGEPELELKLEKPDFSFFFNKAFASVGNQTIGMLPLKSPVFQLFSHPLKTEDFTEYQQTFTLFQYNPEVEKEVNRQLYFSAIPDLSFGEKDWEWLQEYWPMPRDKQAIEGWMNKLVKDSEGVPTAFWRFNLKTAVSSSIRIGNFSLPFQFNLLSLYGFSQFKGEPDIWYNNAVLRLLGEMEYKYDAGKEPLKLPFHITWNEVKPTMLQMALQAGNSTAIALDKFAALLEQQNLNQLFPEEARKLIELVAIQELRLDFDVAQMRPVNLELRFGMPNSETARLPLFENRLELIQPYLILGGSYLGGKIQIYGQMGGSVAFPNTILSGQLNGEVGFIGKQAYFKAELDSGSGINVTQFVRDVLPSSIDVPFVYCDVLSLEGGLNPARLAFDARLTGRTALPVLDAKITNLSLGFELEAGSRRSAKAYLGGSFELFERLRIMVFGQISTEGILFHGAFDSSISKPIQLIDVLPKGTEIPKQVAEIGVSAGSITVDTGKSSIRLEIQFVGSIDFDSYGKIECRKLVLEFNKSGGTYNWKIMLEGGLELIEIEWPDDTKSKLIKLDGTLLVKGDSKGFRQMLFETTPGKDEISNIPVLIPTEIKPGNIIWSEMKFRIKSIEIKNDKTKGWSFESDFTIAFTRLWKPLMDVITNAERKFKLKISKDGMTLKISETVLDLPIPNLILPPVGELPALDLGAGRLQIGDITFTISKKLEVGISIKWFLAENFNLLLGKGENDKPRFDFFQSWNPKEPESSKALALKFTADSSLKIGFSVDNIPIKLIERAEEDWFAINFGPKDERGFGEFGSLWIKKTSLNLNISKGEFLFDTGFKIMRDPAIPLEPFKALLRALNLHDLEKKLGNKVEIPYSNPPQLFKDKKFDVEGIKKILGTQMTTALGDILETLNKLNELLEKLPDRIEPYMEIKPPTEFEFKISVKPDASVTAKFAVKPGLKGIVPMGFSGLAAFELRSFAIGPAFGGQLIRLDIDADVELFDLLSLGLSLAATEGLQHYIGRTKQYHNAIHIKDTTFGIIYQTQIPIIIPILTDKLGFSSYGPGGFGATASYSLKVPSFDLLQGAKLVMAFIKFLRDPKAEMPTGDVSPIDLKFKVNETFLQLPPWLNDAQLGFPQGLPEVSLYNLIAHAMNGIKFFDPVQTLLSIPVDQRVPQAPISFTFQNITFTQRYLLATPYEFLTLKAYERLQLTPELLEIALRVLPPKEGQTRITPETKGVILVLSGSARAGGSSLESIFCLSATNWKKWKAGFYLRGNILTNYHIRLEGIVCIDPPKKPFELEAKGETFLKLLDKEIFNGQAQIKINQTGIRYDGTFKLLEDNPFINFTSSCWGIITSDTVSLSGDLELKVIFIKLAKGTLELTGDKLHLEATGDLGAGASLDIYPKIENNEYFIIVSGSVTVFWTTLRTTVTNNRQGNLMRFQQNFSALGGILGVETDLRAINGGLSGTATLTFGLTLILSAWATNDSIGINGNFNLFPPDSPIQMNLRNVGGSISSAGLSLNGEIEVSLEISGIKLAGAKGTIIINPQLFKIEVKTTVLLVEYTLVLQLINCNNSPILAGAITSWLGTIKLYIVLVPPSINIGDPPCGFDSDEVVVFPHFDEMGSFLMESVASMESKLNTSKKTIFENEMYQLEVDFDLKGANKKLEIELKHLHSEDLFHEIKQFFQQEGIDKNLDIKDASLKIKKQLDGDTKKAKNTLHFPHEKNKKLREIEFNADLNLAEDWFEALLKKAKK